MNALRDELLDRFHVLTADRFVEGPVSKPNAFSTSVCIAVDRDPKLLVVRWVPKNSSLQFYFDAYGS